MFKHRDLFRILSMETYQRMVDETGKVRARVGWGTLVVFSRLR